MTQRATGERVRRDIARLSHAGCDWKAFASRSVSTLRTTVGADGWCLALADPGTLLMCGIVGEDPSGPASRFFELEYGTPDFLLQRELARGRVHAGSLSLATEGRLACSARWREMIEPFGFRDQLRAALVSKTGCWGYLGLTRDRCAPDFSAADVELVARVASAIADGLRLSVMLQRATASDAGDAAGVLTLGDDLSVVSTTPAVGGLLGEEATIGARAPAIVLSVAASTKAKMTRGGVGDASSSARVKAACGWLTATAAPLRSHDGADRIAVIVQAARPSEIAELVLNAYGLTPRQAEVTRQVLAGRSTDEIADELCISVLTVQQHLKSIFDKLGVRSRREVVQTIFDRHYRPRLEDPPSRTCRVDR